MKATVYRDADRVWLEGVSGWSPGDRESSVHAAQAAMMQALDEDVTYEGLVGVSGLAFRMQVSADGLCPSSPHSFCGYPCVARSVQALPWRLRILEVKPEDAEAVAEARGVVRESIDRGAPVQYGNEEDGIIVGYRAGGDVWICYHPLRQGGQETFEETEWPWGVTVAAERKTDLPQRRELALGALRQAQEMWRAGRAEAYHVGLVAWEAYIARLQSLDSADEATVSADMLGNAWIYECLAQYRARGAAYLREVVSEFGGTAARHLSRAAALYERMAREVLTDADHCVLSVAPYPWSLGQGERWTASMRQDQIRRLGEALPLEREALNEIGRALDAAQDGAGT